MRDDIISADLLLFTGSLTKKGGWVEAKKVIELFTMLNKNILAIMGSHDTPAVLGFIESSGHSIHGRGKIIGDVGIFGIGGGNKTLFKRSIEWSEREIQNFMETGYQDVKDCKQILMLCHTAPSGTKLDETYQNLHVGSKSIRSFIFKYSPTFVVSASYQENSQLDRLGNSYLASAGLFSKGNYLYIDTENTENPVTLKNVF